MIYKLLFDYSTNEVDDFMLQTWNLDYPMLDGSGSRRDSHLFLDEEQAVILKLKFSDLDLIQIPNLKNESQNLI